jgi:hypothetical protein
MNESRIPHVEKALIDKSETPIETLLVWTRLPEHSPACEEATARRDMLKAIATEVFSRHLNGYHITWDVASPL